MSGNPEVSEDRISKTQRRRGSYVDVTMMIVLILILILGLAMIYSTSSYRAIALSTYWEDIKGDLYGAGTKTGKTDFIQSDAIANSKWFTEGTARNIYNIHINDEDVMWLDFGKNLSTDGIDNITANTEGRQGIYSLSGTFLGNSSANLPKGIYIIGGKKFVQK